MGVPYPLNWEDRIHNYLVGFMELEDAESGERILVDTSDSRLRQNFEAIAARQAPEPPPRQAVSGQFARRDVAARRSLSGGGSRAGIE